MALIEIPLIDDDVDLVPAAKLSRDLRKSAELLTPEQARFIVDLYYQLQEHRIATGNQARSLQAGGEPIELITWFKLQLGGLEKTVPPVMKVWVSQQRHGRWLIAQHGIGPVLAAGLLAHLDGPASSPAKWWRFAGLDPTVRWEKGQKRPWNHDLKVLCWKIGDSFVKQSGSEKSYYGHVYRKRKFYEVERNERGGNAEWAAKTLEQKRLKDKATIAVYEAGKLPPGRLDLRARRYAVKLLLSHFWEVRFRVQNPDAEPPRPYALAHLEHVEHLAPPLWPID